MYAYCSNNPCLYCDPFGHERFVGVGFQVDISTDHGTFGVEIVIYRDPDVVHETTEDEEAAYVVVMYTYSGISFSTLEIAIAPQLSEMVYSLDLEQLDGMAVDEIIIFLSALMTEYQLSGGVFAIYGYDNFTSADSYSGTFDTWSASVSKPVSSFNVGVYYSYSDTCWAVGMKAGLSRPKLRILPVEVRYSRTYYSNPIVLNQEV